jgi:hypothetical protein
MDIPGDEFAECDYGLVLDNSENIQNFVAKMEAYSQALIQNQMISTSTLFKLWDGSSVSDIRRSIEQDERQIKQQRAEEAEAQNEQVREELEAKKYLEEEKLRIEEDKNIRDNQTKILIEEMKNYSNQSEMDIDDEYDPIKKKELEEKIRQFNEELRLKREKLNKEVSLKSQELEIKRKQSNKPINNK